jgi:hypothetical protein
MIKGNPDDSGLKATYSSSISSDATEDTSESSESESESESELLEAEDETEETEGDRLRFLTGSSSPIARKSEPSLAASSSESALFCPGQL